MNYTDSKQPASNSPIALLLKEKPDAFKMLKAGDFVEGKFLLKDKKSAFFDLGRFGTGIVYGVEFGNAQDILKTLEPGAVIGAKVVDSENEEGYIELSLTKATRHKAWIEIQDLKERGEVLPFVITGANSGGLMGDLKGIKAFLPVSQLGATHYPVVDDGSREKILEALKQFVGAEFQVKILDFNPRGKRLIVSERESVSENVKESLAKYAAGDVISGVISGIADFGAFVRFADHPEIEGLIHISELDHTLIENPKDIVKLHDEVKAKIIDIKDGKVTLSLKALKPDPWAMLETKYAVGQEVKGTVTRFNPFGAFVALGDVQGLIHVSEFGSVEEMQKQLQIGASYTFKIDVLKPKEKRVILKLVKNANIKVENDSSK